MTEDDHPTRAPARFTAILAFDAIPPAVARRTAKPCCDGFGPVLAGKGARQPDGGARPSSGRMPRSARRVVR